MTDSFYQLQPKEIIEAAVAAGFDPTGEISQLNSYENRVFELRMENKDKIIAKFYRPGRWSEQALHEEHNFLFDLEKEGLTVASPLILKNKKSLLFMHNMWVAFFPKVIGRLPQEFIGNDLEQVGKKLALLHNVGRQKSFLDRPVIGENLDESLDFLQSWISPEVRTRYNQVAEDLIIAFDGEIDPDCFQRIHGDCHRGNLLNNGKEFFFVDFDDSMMGPAIQDFWMLFSSMEAQDDIELIRRGYEELSEFPDEQVEWVSLLRGARILNYACWIARRWKDPSFPRLFPEFNTYSYWAEECESLEKIAWKINQSQS